MAAYLVRYGRNVKYESIKFSLKESVSIAFEYINPPPSHLFEKQDEQ